jgi:zinc protease
VLVDCLTAAPAGRVYKALVESKKASTVAGDALGLHDPGVIEILAKVEDATKVEAARTALIDTVEGLKSNPISDEEVARSKQKFRKRIERELAASDEFAVELSNWASTGDWRLFFLHRDRLDGVTAADVNRVAAKYLTRNNRTIGTFYPTKQAERAEIPETPDVAKLVAGYKGREATVAGEAFEPTPENIEKRVSRGTLGSIKTAFLPKKTRGEMVELTLHLRYGSEESLTGQTTAADLMPAMLNRGTRSHTRQQLKDELDKHGAQLSFMGQAGLVMVTVKVKRAEFGPTLKLVGEMLRESTFPESEFTILKNQRIEQINTRKTEPDALAMVAVSRKLNDYPKENIRYVPTIEESIERLRAVTVDQVKAIYEKQLSAQAGELAVVGDFDPKVVTAELGTTLKDWTTSVPYKRIDRPAKPVEKGEKIKIETPDKANAVFFAALTYPMTDAEPEIPALELGNFLLGAAPLAARLDTRIRGKEGLSYTVGSMVEAHPKDKNTAFYIFALANPVNMAKVDGLVDEELGKFLKEGVSLDELSTGKKAYLEAQKVERSDDANLAALLAQDLFIGRTFQFVADQEKKIAELTREEISTAFNKVVDPKKLVIVEAGDFAKAAKKKDEPKKDVPKK